MVVIVRPSTFSHVSASHLGASVVATSKLRFQQWRLQVPAWGVSEDFFGNMWGTGLTLPQILYRMPINRRFCQTYVWAKVTSCFRSSVREGFPLVSGAVKSSKVRCSPHRRAFTLIMPRDCAPSRAWPASLIGDCCRVGRANGSGAEYGPMITPRAHRLSNPPRCRVGGLACA